MSAQIVHEIAIAVDAKAVGLAWVVVAVATAIIIVHCLVFSVIAGVVVVAVAAAVVAMVSDVGDADDVAIIVHWLAFSVAVEDTVVAVGILHLLWLCDRACIPISCACDVGLFLHLVVIQFGFCGFGWI